MNNNIKNKLEQMILRLEEVEILLSDTTVMSDQEKFKNLSIEHAELSTIVSLFNDYKQLEEDLEAAQEILNEDDIELKAMAKEEINNNKKLIKDLEFKLKAELLPKDEYDNRNIILEIRAGTGGDEASIFVGDLFKMYSRYTEKQGWKMEIMNSSTGDHGGFKEIIANISGLNVYSKMKFESGTHRVQRVPDTESQGRVHTSACTVAIMPEVKEIAEVDINMNDVRVDTFRASGAGGQHVNKTDSAVRVTHIPTGVVVECQDGRSQHKNKAQALSVLASRILASRQEEQAKTQANERKTQVGSGDRSEKIRTYNYPQGRVSDHRIKLTLYKLNEIMEGDLAEVIEPLILEWQTRQMAQINDQ